MCAVPIKGPEKCSDQIFLLEKKRYKRLTRWRYEYLFISFPAYRQATETRAHSDTTNVVNCRSNL